VRPIGRTAKFSTIDIVDGREINIKFSGNSSSGHSACQLHASKLETSVALCCVILHTLAFYCPQHKVHLCNDHAVYSASWYATPVRWVDYLGKSEMLTNRNVKKFVHNIWKKYAFLCLWKNSRIFYFNTWNMGATRYMLCLYFCSVYVCIPNDTLFPI
jgi:hypothetical protein